MSFPGGRIGPASGARSADMPAAPGGVAGFIAAFLLANSGPDGADIGCGTGCAPVFGGSAAAAGEPDATTLSAPGRRLWSAPGVAAAPFKGCGGTDRPKADCVAMAGRGAASADPGRGMERSSIGDLALAGGVAAWPAVGSGARRPLSGDTPGLPPTLAPPDGACAWRANTACGGGSGSGGGVRAARPGSCRVARWREAKTGSAGEACGATGAAAARGLRAKGMSMLGCGSVCGPDCGPVCGPTCGPVCGPVREPVREPICGPVCGPNCGPTCGPDGRPVLAADGPLPCGAAPLTAADCAPTCRARDANCTGCAPAAGNWGVSVRPAPI